MLTQCAGSGRPMNLASALQKSGVMAASSLATRSALASGNSALTSATALSGLSSAKLQPFRLALTKLRSTSGFFSMKSFAAKIEVETVGTP